MEMLFECSSSFFITSQFHLEISSFLNSEFVMCFTFIIFQLMFSINSSLGANPVNKLMIFPVNLSSVAKPENKTHEAEGTNQDTKPTNESTKFTKCIKKSELEEFVQCKQKFDMKNNIDQFETHWGIHFEPNSAELDKFQSPVDLDYEIRRLKWIYILENFGDSLAIKGLNSVLLKAGINRTTFCDDIADSYMRLTHFEGESVTYANLMQKKSVQVFQNYVSDSKYKCDENEKQVQVPESLYNELIRSSANVAVLKRHHEDKIALLKQRYEKKISNLKRICSKRIEECKEESDYDKRSMINEDISSEY
ncbi:uncharacterized protein LOC135833637 [Planococcus citri]|uniref:uncharacterized protein LOC135833637 n=1 Tax=Planococcus citri TaxID=170843 RepID=UPI0031F93E45